MLCTHPAANLAVRKFARSVTCRSVTRVVGLCCAMNVRSCLVAIDLHIAITKGQNVV